MLARPSLARATNMKRALRVVLLFSLLECRLKEPKLGSWVTCLEITFAQ